MGRIQNSDSAERVLSAINDGKRFWRPNFSLISKTLDIPVSTVHDIYTRYYGRERVD